MSDLAQQIIAESAERMRQADEAAAIATAAFATGRWQEYWDRMSAELKARMDGYYTPEPAVSDAGDSGASS